MRSLLLLSLSSLAGAAARAHEGHGLPGAAHWHAGDAAGWLVLLVAAALLWWKGRG